ncbi:RBR-type E3 ubiquitin transferase [Madurella fahalii]|uniref:RBR-type E3 ubiquitin transferase n=1 Tax=Madurella fahalii TaxID=1157608 RepID=A0ABQ0GMK1_9PEZI
MADLERQQGGPRTSRRKKNAAKLKSQSANDWPRTGEPLPRSSPRRKRHGDIDIDVDIDIVESSDDANNDAKASPRKPQRRRRRPQHAPSSSTESDTTTPTKTPQRSPAERSFSMRLPNASVPVLDRARTPSRHRRPTYVYEEDDDDDDDDDNAPRGPSRPQSRQAIARRDVSTHRYRSTPESRRSPRTSVSDSEDDTKVTSDSDEEQVIHPRDKHLPPAPIAPAVPAAPPAPALHSSLQERLSRQPEVEYEEPDSTSRYAPSMGRHRSRSRAPSSMRDEYRRPRDISVSRPPSPDKARSRSRSKRRPSGHYESDAYVSRPSSSYKRPHAGAGSHFASSHSLGSSRRSTFFAGDFAASAAPAVAPAHPSHSAKPAKRFTMCIVCRNDKTPVDKTVKLRCRHRMCHSCLRRVFKMSLTDPQHMPPRCCTVDHIPLKHVEKLFDVDFKREWNQKYMEYTTRSRLYCPSRRCGEWIRPEDIRREGGRGQAKCSRCSTKVCASCSGKWHYPSECPRDKESIQFPDQAKREAWQRCHRCKAMIELRDGCDHMTCRCGAEFCVVCGGKWKTCECPWFKHDPFDGDATGLTHAPMNSQSNPFLSEPAYDPGPATPHDFQSDFGPPPTASARPRPSSYEEEAYLRRLQEQRDEHFARRMHSFDAFGHQSGHADYARSRRDYDFDEPRDSRRRSDFRGHGGFSLGDEEYHRRAATVVAPSPPQTHVPTAPPPPRSAFEPPSRPTFDRSASAFEYSGGIPRDRGTRYASPERYDDYMENYVAEPRRHRSPDRWNAFSRERRPRSPDRRAFTSAAGSRPQSPETWQQLPTRYPSPERPAPALERHMSVKEERRRAPSPELRRASSLEQRLADRFRPESRQSPAGPPMPVGTVGPLGPLGPVGPLGPLSPTRGAGPPVSRAATHPIVPGPVPGMPLAPIPPPGPPPGPAPSIRRHTMDEDPYLPGGGMPPMAADWFGPPPGLGGGGGGGLPGMGMHHPGMGMHDMDNGAGHGSPRAPNVRRRPPGQAHREHNKFEVPRSSVLAGLGGMGRGVHRVSEWVNFVEPGPPDVELQATR